MTEAIKAIEEKINEMERTSYQAEFSLRSALRQADAAATTIKECREAVWQYREALEKLKEEK